MKSFLEKFEEKWRQWCYAIGVVWVVLTILGMLDVIDFHTCIKGPGHCKIIDPTVEKQ